MKSRPYNRAASLIHAFERARRDARHRKSVNQVPYAKKEMADSWIRGVNFDKELERKK